MEKPRSGLSSSRGRSERSNTHMVITLSRFASITATIAIAVAGWFGTQSQALSTRVDGLSIQEAARGQQVQDVDTRLTRIENKLDRALSNGVLGGNKVIQ